MTTTNPTCMQLPWYRTQVSTVWPVGICLRYGMVQYNILTYNRITSHITCEMTIITNTNCPNHRTVTSKVIVQKSSTESLCLITIMTEWSLLLLNATLHDHPFTTWLYRRARSGRWTSFRRRVWFIKSHIVLLILFLLILFIHFILDIKRKSCCYPVKQLNHFPVKYHSHFTYTPPLTTLSYTTALSLDCLCPLSAANISLFKSLPAQPPLPFTNGSWTYVDRLNLKRMARNHP